MTISKRLTQIMTIGAVAIAALIYLVFANSLSETDMVRLAYVWVPVAVTGGLLWFTGKRVLKFALIWFFATLMLLFAFFEIIFPLL